MKGDKLAYSSNFPSSQYGREGEGLKWTGQDVPHQNYGLYTYFIIFNEQNINSLIRLTGNNRIFTHINGGILPDYNRQQNNLLQNK